jgi:Na+-translocating ferredoxin:NAD+ oxidoreductase RnfG subunit
MTDQPKSDLGRKLATYVAVLTGICLVSAAGVSALYTVSIERIRANAKKSFNESLALVMGEATDTRPINPGAAETEIVYAGRLPDGRTRYAALGSAQGYQSRIVVLVSVDGPVGADPVINAVAVVSSGETPGLGEDIHKVEADVTLWGAIIGAGNGEQRRPAFQEQFSGKKLSDLKVRKGAGPDGIIPITGATISSRAVTNAARQGVERIIAAAKAATPDAATRSTPYSESRNDD